MIIALALLILVLMSAAVIGSQLERAPEGFEDNSGFHFVSREASEKSTGGALVGPEEHAVASVV